MLRRTFLASAAAPLARLAASAPAGIRLGYDTYSIRSWGWKAMEHLEFSGSLKLNALQLSSLGDFESLEPAYLEKVRRRAEELGISLDGGTGCICPTTKSYNPKNGDPAAGLIKTLEVAKAIGAKTVRCFMGSIADRQGPDPIEKHIAATVKVIRACRSKARDLDVKIALENHGDMQAWEMKALIEEAGRDCAGATLDTGNPATVVEDPVVTLEVLGPYAVTTHYRDTALAEHPRGATMQWTVMGQGTTDLKRQVELHRQHCPQANMQLEIITGRAPVVLPYMEDEFWKAFPKARAAEFARFVALVKRGRQFSGGMMVAEGSEARVPEFAAALKTQQKRDLEKSLVYCMKELGAGKQG